MPPRRALLSDIDLLGYAENDVAVMETMFREACTVVVVDDGLRFDATTLVGRRIKDDVDFVDVKLPVKALTTASGERLLKKR